MIRRDAKGASMLTGAVNICDETACAASTDGAIRSNSADASSDEHAPGPQQQAGKKRSPEIVTIPSHPPWKQGAAANTSTRWVTNNRPVARVRMGWRCFIHSPWGQSTRQGSIYPTIDGSATEHKASAVPNSRRCMQSGPDRERLYALPLTETRQAHVTRHACPDLTGKIDPQLATIH